MSKNFWTDMEKIEEYQHQILNYSLLKNKEI